MIKFNRRIVVAMSSFALAGAPLVAFAQPAPDAPAHAAGANSMAPAAQMAPVAQTAPAAMPADASKEAAVKTVPPCDKDMMKHCKAMGHKHKKGGRHHRKMHKAAPAMAQ